MSVGSDPIECCVRGRFLCVCVTARRRGFRGGPFASGLRETSFDLFRAPFRHRFRGGRGIGEGFLFPLCCAFRLVPALRHPAFSRSRTMAGLRSFRTSAGGGRRSALPLHLRFGGRGPCRRFSRSGRLRTKVRIAFDGSKTRCMLRPFRAGPLPSAGPAAEEDGPSLSIRER